MNYYIEDLSPTSIEKYLLKNGWRIEKIENGGFLSISPKNILDGKLEIYFPNKKINVEIIKPYKLKYYHYEILTQASLTLKARNPIKDVKIDGYVVATQDKSKDLLIQTQKITKRTIVVAGLISIEGEIDEKESQFKRKEVTVYLNEENYNQAVIAHKDSLKVIVVGDLYRKNKNDLEIPKVKEFKVFKS